MNRIKLAWVVLRYGREALYDFAEFIELHDIEANEFVDSFEVVFTENLDKFFTTRASLEQE